MEFLSRQKKSSFCLQLWLKLFCIFWEKNKKEPISALLLVFLPPLFLFFLSVKEELLKPVISPISFFTFIAIVPLTGPKASILVHCEPSYSTLSMLISWCPGAARSVLISTQSTSASSTSSLCTITAAVWYDDFLFIELICDIFENKWLLLYVKNHQMRSSPNCLKIWVSGFYIVTLFL